MSDTLIWPQMMPTELAYTGGISLVWTNAIGLIQFTYPPWVIRIAYAYQEGAYTLAPYAYGQWFKPIGLHLRAYWSRQQRMTLNAVQCTELAGPILPHSIRHRTDPQQPSSFIELTPPGAEDFPPLVRCQPQ